ncbi:MAG TPA: hypothetical protein VF545_11595 [Thermoleophilaceae bacterium]
MILLQVRGLRQVAAEGHDGALAGRWQREQATHPQQRGGSTPAAAQAADELG